VPPGKQIVKSIWIFRRKRHLNGEIHKLKARFVVRGDLQILDGAQSTFSPMVSWSTVRLLFVLTVSRRLHSITIDFNNAFVQSILSEPIYLELPPQGIHPQKGLIMSTKYQNTFMVTFEQQSYGVSISKTF
jgi:hypothetical protein